MGNEKRGKGGEKAGKKKREKEEKRGEREEENDDTASICINDGVVRAAQLGHVLANFNYDQMTTFSIIIGRILPSLVTFGTLVQFLLDYYWSYTTNRRDVIPLLRPSWDKYAVTAFDYYQAATFSIIIGRILPSFITLVYWCN